MTQFNPVTPLEPIAIGAYRGLIGEGLAAFLCAQLCARVAAELAAESAVQLDVQLDTQLDARLTAQLANIAALVAGEKGTRLSQGRYYIVKLPLSTPQGDWPVAVKVFARQGRFKDWADRRRGSRAERSYRAAV